MNSNINSVGLTSQEVIRSREKHGDNSLPFREGQSFFRQFISSFGDPIIKILIAALAANIVFTLKDFNIAESIGIIIAILTSATVSSISEYGSEKAFEKLKKESEQIKCRVIRDGKTTEVGIRELVCGDIVLLSAGERVPADGKMISGAIKLDMSALNGESKEVKKYPLGDSTYGMKSDSPDIVLRGSVVTGGEAVMKVMSVGASTFYGRLAGELSESTRISPLKLKLTKLARQISRIGYIAAILVTSGYLFNEICVDSGFDSSLMLAKVTDIRYILGILIHALTLGISIVVVAVPEGITLYD